MRDTASDESGLRLRGIRKLVMKWGMKMKSGNKRDGEKVWNAFKQMKDYLDKSLQIIDKADGDNYYTNRDGRRMYDGVSTLLNTNIGHGNTELADAIREQLCTLDNATLFTCTSDVAIRCAKKLCSLSGDYYFSAFFCNSGSEACDTAIKIVLKYWKNKGEKRNKIVSLKGAYHGSGIGAMMLAHGGYSMEDYSLEHENFHQVAVPDETERLPGTDEEAWIDGYVQEFEDYCDENQGKIAAFFFEPVQLSNAVNVLPERYVQKMCSVCRQRGILVVADEVATGFGRTGNMFASQHYGVWGDLMMLAKGITSGYIPMGAVMVTQEIYRNFYGETLEGKHLEHGYTTGGHPAACAAALTNIRLLERNNCTANAREKGSYLLCRLKEKIGQSELVAAIRGKGLMMAVIFEDITVKSMENWGIAEILTNFLIQKGILLYPDDRNILIIAPCLNVTKEECDMLTDAMKDAVGKLEIVLGKNAG